MERVARKVLRNLFQQKVVVYYARIKDFVLTKTGQKISDKLTQGEISAHPNHNKDVTSMNSFEEYRSNIDKSQKSPDTRLIQKIPAQAMTDGDDRFSREIAAQGKCQRFPIESLSTIIQNRNEKMEKNEMKNTVSELSSFCVPCISRDLMERYDRRLLFNKIDEQLVNTISESDGSNQLQKSSQSSGHFPAKQSSTAPNPKSFPASVRSISQKIN